MDPSTPDATEESADSAKLAQEAAGNPIDPYFQKDDPADAADIAAKRAAQSSDTVNKY